MLETILTVGVIWWVLLAFTVIALLGSVLNFKSSGGASLLWFIVFIGLTALLFKEPLTVALSGYNTPSGWNFTSLAVLAAEVLAFWLVAGAVTAFFYWLSFVKDVSNAYNEIRLGWLANFKNNKSRKHTSLWPERTQAVIAKMFAVSDRDQHNAFTKVGAACPNIDYPDSLEELVRNHKPIVSGMYPRIPAVLPDVPWSQADDAQEQALLDDIEGVIRTVLPPRAGGFKAAILFAAIVWPVTALSLIFEDMLRHLWDWIFERARAFFDACSAKIFGEI